MIHNVYSSIHNRTMGNKQNHLKFQFNTRHYKAFNQSIYVIK